jgi:hypothetical protein
MVFNVLWIWHECCCVFHEDVLAGNATSIREKIWIGADQFQLDEIEEASWG